MNWTYFVAVFLVVFVVVFIINAVKASKDPDVIEASKLRMTVDRYRMYKKIDHDISCIYNKYGTDSAESYEKVNDILKRVKNKNEWERFMDYQYKKTMEEMFDIFK